MKDPKTLRNMWKDLILNEMSKYPFLESKETVHWYWDPFMDSVRPFKPGHKFDIHFFPPTLIGSSTGRKINWAASPYKEIIYD